MEWGEGLPAIQRAAASGSEKAQARLDSRPVLPMWLHDTWAAFWKVGSCRQVGMGTGPIPWTAINDYAIRYRINGEDFEDFEHIIREMDGCYLEKQRAKQDAKK